MTSPPNGEENPNYETDNPVLVIVEEQPPDRSIRGYGFVVSPKRICAELDVTDAPKGRRSRGGDVPLTRSAPGSSRRTAPMNALR